MGTMGISQKLFGKAMQIEALAGEVYDLIAARFESEARKLFSQLAAEERQHELRLRTLSTLARHDRELDKAALPTEAGLDLLIQDAKTLRAMAGGPASALTLRQAIQLAQKLEEGLAAVHAEIVISTSDVPVRRFFDKLAQDDRAHLALLSSAPLALP